MDMRLRLKEGWIASDEDPYVFARKHGFEIFSRPCDDCGEPMTTTVPFRFRTSRGVNYGLVAPLCECGSDDNPPYCMLLEAFCVVGAERTERRKRKRNRR
jgi:hypothetical protein